MLEEKLDAFGMPHPDRCLQGITVHTWALGINVCVMAKKQFNHFLEMRTMRRRSGEGVPVVSSNVDVRAMLDQQLDYLPIAMCRGAL